MAKKRAGTEPPPPPGSERRRHERFRVLAQVEFSAKGEVSILPVVNLSAGGVLLRLDTGTPAKVEGGDRVSIFVDLSELIGEELCLSLEAEVVRVQDGIAGLDPTIALMWTSQDPEVVAKLATVLTRLSEK